MVTFETCDHGSMKVITFRGRLTAAETDVVRNDIFSVVQQAKGDVIFDVSNLDLLASDGLAMIIGARNKAIKNNKKVIIVCKNDNIREVFEITKLYKIFAIYDTVEEALKK